MDDKVCYIILDPTVPEHFVVDEGDDYILEWCFDWDDRPPEKDREFQDWLNALPIGRITHLPRQYDRDGYRVVKCIRSIPTS